MLNSDDKRSGTHCKTAGAAECNATGAGRTFNCLAMNANGRDNFDFYGLLRTKKGLILLYKAH